MRRTRNAGSRGTGSGIDPGKSNEGGKKKEGESPEGKSIEKIQKTDIESNGRDNLDFQDLLEKLEKAKKKAGETERSTQYDIDSPTKGKGEETYGYRSGKVRGRGTFPVRSWKLNGRTGNKKKREADIFRGVTLERGWGRGKRIYRNALPKPANEN